MLLSQIDDVIAQDNASGLEKVEFTPELLHSMARELNAALAEKPEPKTREEKEERKAKQKQVRELEEKAGKFAEYDRHLETFGAQLVQQDRSRCHLHAHERGCDEQRTD